MINPIGQQNYIPPQQRAPKETKTNSTAAETAIKENMETRADETREAPVQKTAEVMQSLASQEKSHQKSIENQKMVNPKAVSQAYQKSK